MEDTLTGAEEVDEVEAGGDIMVSPSCLMFPTSYLVSINMQCNSGITVMHPIRFEPFNIYRKHFLFNQFPKPHSFFSGIVGVLYH